MWKLLAGRQLCGFRLSENFGALSFVARDYHDEPRVTHLKDKVKRSSLRAYVYAVIGDNCVHR